MSAIRTKGTATDPDLPTDEDLKSYLEGLATTRAWYQMDPEHATLSASNVVTGLSPAGAGVTLLPAGANPGPALAAEAAYAGFTAAQYDSAALSRSLLGIASYFTGAFSILACCRRGSITAAAAAIVQPGGTGGAMTALQCGADGAWQAWHRGTGLTLPGPAFPDATPQLVIASYDGTTFRAQVDGYAQRNGTPSGAVPANAEFSVGGNSNNRFVGDIGDIVILSVPILEAAQSELLADWRAYFDDVYG